MKLQLNAFFTTLAKISTRYYWTPLNQLGIFQTTVHHLTTGHRRALLNNTRQSLPIELVDLSVVSEQAVYLFLDVRHLGVNVSRKAFNLQRFHL